MYLYIAASENDENVTIGQLDHSIVECTMNKSGKNERKTNEIEASNRLRTDNELMRSFFSLFSLLIFDVVYYC